MSLKKLLGASGVVLVLALAVVVVLQQLALADLRRDQAASDRRLTQLQEQIDEPPAADPAVGDLETEVARLSEHAETICGDAVLNEYRANLDGQQLANGYEFSSYYSNLYAIINAICGEQMSPAG